LRVLRKPPVKPAWAFKYVDASKYIAAESSSKLSTCAATTALSVIQEIFEACSSPSLKKPPPPDRRSRFNGEKKAQQTIARKSQLRRQRHRSLRRKSNTKNLLATPMSHHHEATSRSKGKDACGVPACEVGRRLKFGDLDSDSDSDSDSKSSGGLLLVPDD